MLLFDRFVGEVEVVESLLACNHAKLSKLSRKHRSPGMQTILMTEAAFCKQLKTNLEMWLDVQSVVLPPQELADAHAMLASTLDGDCDGVVEGVDRLLLRCVQAKYFVFEGRFSEALALTGVGGGGDDCRLKLENLLPLLYGDDDEQRSKEASGGDGDISAVTRESSTNNNAAGGDPSMSFKQLLAIQTIYSLAYALEQSGDDWKAHAFYTPLVAYYQGDCGGRDWDSVYLKFFVCNLLLRHGLLCQRLSLLPSDGKSASSKKSILQHGCKSLYSHLQYTRAQHSNVLKQCAIDALLAMLDQCHCRRSFVAAFVGDDPAFGADDNASNLDYSLMRINTGNASSHNAPQSLPEALYTLSQLQQAFYTENGGDELKARSLNSTSLQGYWSRLSRLQCTQTLATHMQSLYSVSSADASYHARLMAVLVGEGAWEKALVVGGWYLSGGGSDAYSLLLIVRLSLMMFVCDNSGTDGKGVVDHLLSSALHKLTLSKPGNDADYSSDMRRPINNTLLLAQCIRGCARIKAIAECKQRLVLFSNDHHSLFLQALHTCLAISGTECGEDAYTAALLRAQGLMKKSLLICSVQPLGWYLYCLIVSALAASSGGASGEDASGYDHQLVLQIIDSALEDLDHSSSASNHSRKVCTDHVHLALLKVECCRYLGMAEQAISVLGALVGKWTIPSRPVMIAENGGGGSSSILNTQSVGSIAVGGSAGNRGNLASCTPAEFRSRFYAGTPKTFLNALDQEGEPREQGRAECVATRLGLTTEAWKAKFPQPLEEYLLDRLYAPGGSEAVGFDRNAQYKKSINAKHSLKIQHTRSLLYPQKGDPHLAALLWSHLAMAYMRSATATTKERSLHEAGLAINEAMQINQLSPLPYIAMGMLAEQKGDNEGALEAFERAHIFASAEGGGVEAAAAGCVDALLGCSRIYQRMSDSADAKGTTDNTGNRDTAASLKCKQLAIHYAQLAHTLDPSNPNTVINLARVLPQDPLFKSPSITSTLRRGSPLLPFARVLNCVLYGDFGM